MALTKITKDVIDIPGVSAAFQADTTAGGLRNYVDTQNTAQTLATITAQGATTSAALTLGGAVTVNSVFTINDTSAIKIPVGTGAQRPATPLTGMLRYTTDGTPGFGLRLDVDFEIVEFDFIVNDVWKPRFQKMSQEEIVEVSRNFNNVYDETHMKLQVIK